MSNPTIKLNATFATHGTVDLAAYVRRNFSLVRGSTSPSLTGLIADQGTLSVTLDNTDRRFDPGNASSPYYPDLVPGVPVSLVATWNSTDYPLFKGTVSGWPQLYPSQGIDQVVTLQVSDGVRTFQRAKLAHTFPAQLTGARISAVLAAIGYDGTSDIDAGTTKVPFVEENETKSQAWSLMADASSAEWGSLFVKADGTLVFLDRNGIAFDYPVSATSQATFTGPNVSNLPFTDVVVNYDDQRIVNDANLRWNTYGDIAHAEDLTSQGKPWGIQSWEQGYQVSRGTLARAYVQWLVFRYANPTTRVERLVVKPQGDPTDLWPIVLSLELGTKITVNVTPRSGTGGQISKLVFIRSIENDFSDGLWTTTYTLDDADWTSVVIRYDDGHVYDDGSVYSF